jgi:hypothetical protein
MTGAVTPYQRTTHLLFGFEGPRDWLSKLEREYALFCGPVDDVHARTSHAMNFAITAWAMCDWLAADAVPNGNKAQLAAELDRVQTLHVGACASLGVMRDIANAAKHRALTGSRPTLTRSARTSLAPTPAAGTIALGTSVIYAPLEEPEAAPPMVVHNVEDETGKATFLVHANQVLEHFRREVRTPAKPGGPPR